MSLSESLRRYRLNLIGLAVFPSAFFIGGVIFHIPFFVFIPFFFLACGFAAWPCLSRRAPYMFWIVGCGVWIGGGLLAMVLLQTVKLLMAFF